jgi:hypothetical protein
MLSWASSANLGSIETGFISELSILAQQSTSTSNIHYNVFDGVLPPGLRLNRDGTIAGRVSYASTGTYTFTLLANDIINNEQTTGSFSITVVGSTTDAYFKVTDGTGNNDFVIKLTDPAKIQNARDQINGVVPKLSITGLIIKSTADYNPNYSYHFDPDTIDFFEVAVEVCDATFDYTEDNLADAGGAFLPGLQLCPWNSLLLEEIAGGTTTDKFTDAYFKPHFTLTKRSQYRDFINNEKIFDPKLIYRPYDQHFGVQTNIKMVLDFGIEQLNLEEYVYALRENFYRKRLWLGKVKTATAKDSQGNAVYDVIYVDVVDDMVNSQGISADPVFYTPWNDEIYYPGSVDNMRRQLHTITLRDYTYIGVKNGLQPRFMLSQPPSEKTSTYMRVVPLCYTLPGKSSIIVNKIAASGFKFNRLDFEIDRLIVSNTLDNNTAKYLIFSRQAAGDLLDIDAYIFGPEGWQRWDTETDEPLKRE